MTEFGRPEHDDNAMTTSNTAENAAATLPTPSIEQVDRRASKPASVTNTPKLL